MTSTPLALVPTERPHMALIHPVMDAASVMKVHEAIAELVQGTLVEGKDYGIIPGTDKAALYKSGSERLCVGFGLVDTYEIIETAVDHRFENAWEKRKRSGEIYKSGTAYGLYSYTVKCLLRRREDNMLIAEGLGSCSSLESKYCDRPRDVANTVLKMAKKRAKVDAVLSGLGLSDRFTQDVEDDRALEDEHGNAVEKPTGGEVKAAPAKPDISKMTLEQALKLTLRGKEGSWGGFAKKPFADVPYNLLVNALDFFKKLAADNPEDLGAQIDVRALTLVIESQRAHEEAKAVAEKEARDGADMFAQAGAGAPQDSPAGESVAKPDGVFAPPASGPALAALDDLMKLSPSDLRAKVISLLDRPELAMLRVDTMATISKPTSKKQYAELWLELMKIVEAGTTSTKPRNARGEPGVLPGEELGS